MNLNKLFQDFCKKNNYEINNNQLNLIDQLKNFYNLNINKSFLKKFFSKNNKIKLQEGMVVSNEPGYYEKNNFGIRIENLIYIKKTKQKNHFENLTMAPIDKELINKKLLSKDEKNWIKNGEIWIKFLL